uniref:Aldo_ket_red domain-containing protein n=2 Tax=Mesocestoides corti TaxID=53468 RepID=A0A5K3FNR7_MESCO
MIYENEEEIGSGISKALLSKGLAREDLFITTKLWCDKHAPEDVRPACEQSLKRLGLEYLDLYLIHLPTAFHTKPGEKMNPDGTGNVIFEKQSLENTWKAMECLVAAGLVKSIGVSNFNRKQLDRIMSAGSIVPAVNQIEVNVDFMNTKLIEYCWSKGINIEAYGVLGNPGVMGARKPPLLEQPFIKKIAAAHNKTPAQILLRHGLQRGLVVLCKSVTPSRLELNFNVLDFELSEEEMKILNTSGRNIRTFDIPAIKDHPEYPHKEE